MAGFYKTIWAKLAIFRTDLDGHTMGNKDKRSSTKIGVF